MTSHDTAIHTRAMLVWLTISTWSARKYDRKVSEKVNADYHASTDAGRYNKFLLPGDAASYKRLINLSTALREWHYSETLAWSDEGWRLLSTANYMHYTEGYRKRVADIVSARDEFVAEYPAIKAQARIKLNGLYREEDYPSTADIAQRFAVNVEYAPVPAQGDLRVDLSSADVALIEQQISARVENAVKVAVQDSWSRLHGVVARISERLNDPEAIFRDSLIENATELCDTLKRLNVTDDPDLETMRQRVLRELASRSPDVLRTNKHAREQVASKADQIMRDMSAFYSA